MTRVLLCPQRILAVLKGPTPVKRERGWVSERWRTSLASSRKRRPLKCSLSNVDRRQSGRLPISSARSIFEVTLPSQFVAAKLFEKDSQRLKFRGVQLKLLLIFATKFAIYQYILRKPVLEYPLQSPKGTYNPQKVIFVSMRQRISVIVLISSLQQEPSY